MTQFVNELGSLPAVACIIVNWNGWHDTIDCLNALNQCTYPNVTIIVVDNGSTDDSVARILAAHPNTVLLRSQTNLGFAAGNNIGILHAIAHGTAYFWLLNNDTKPAPEALTALVAKALKDERIGAVGSICYYADRPHVVQSWAGARANLWIGFARDNTKPRKDSWFHYIYGASILLNRNTLEHVGLLDEGFFLYWEETELCLRLREKGWLLAAAPDSHILHKVNASTGGNKLVLDRYFTASGLRILRLHSPAPYLAMLIFLAIRFTRRVLRFELSRCDRVWQGIQDYRHTPLPPQNGSNV